jgi:hypothetical protein
VWFLNIKKTLIEVLQSIIPLALIIIVLRWLIVGLTIGTFLNFTIGIILTIIGFTLFLVGANLSLLPIGEMIGKSLITKGSLWYVLGWGAAMGFVTTVAEPGVQILANQALIVSGGEISRLFLIFSISLGLGIFLSIAFLRIIFKIPLILILLISYAIILVLSFFVNPEFMTIAFDSGGVTTGPMTVPFILALGIGMTSVMKSRRGTDDNFGLIGLASIGPILAVLILGVIYG